MSAKFNLGDIVMFRYDEHPTNQIGEVVLKPKKEYHCDDQPRTWVRWQSGPYAGKILQPVDRFLHLVAPSTLVDECADFFV